MSKTPGWMHTFGAWVLGAATVVAPWLAIRFVPVSVNEWASIYIGGCLGGLVLELLLGRGRLELPSRSAADLEEDKTDERRPLGPQLDLGFFARVASGGLASVALLLVYYTLIDGATGTELSALASESATFGWAVFLGASSPAVWGVAGRMVEARLGTLEARNADLLQQLEFVASKIEEGQQATSGEPTLAGDVQATVTTVAASAEPVIASAADASPGTVDVRKLALSIGEDVAELLPEAAQATQSTAAASAALNEALGAAKAALGRS